MNDRRDLLASIDGLSQWLSSVNHHYYSVNSVPSPRVVTSLCRRFKGVGIFWRQLFRLCPVNLRPTGCENTPIDPKANILFAAAYLRLMALCGDAFEERFMQSLDRVMSLRSRQTSLFAIRQNRDLYLKYWQAGKDSISPLLTSWSGDLFLACYDYFQSQEYLDLAGQVAEYFMREYPKEESEEGVYFRYAPGLSTRIYNASAQISAFLLDYGTIADSPRAADYGYRGIHYVARAQNSDGSWFYGEGKGLRYIDSFHTAFILQALHRSVSSGGGPAFREALTRGLRYYTTTLFKADEDGAWQPVHFDKRYWPSSSSAIQRVDIRDCALAIILFSALSREDPVWAANAEAVLKWADLHMKAGACYWAEVTWLWKNRIPYIEFQAWMLLSLARYLEAVCCASEV